jgi:outer membrane lipoprotein SlyB
VKPSSYDVTTASMATVAIICAAVLALAGCGPQDGEALSAQPPAQVAQADKPAAAPVPRADTGQVSGIETLTERPKGSGVGAVAGGVLGGVAGYQIGDGNGQKAATAAGAIGGAMLGNKIERDRAERIVGFRVHVRLDNGTERSFEQSRLAGLRVGHRVRVDGGQLTPA